MSMARSYRPGHDVRFRILGDEAVVLRQSDPEVFVLNGVGARVFELLAAGLDVGAVVETITDEFETTTEVAERDVREFLAELAEARLIESAEEQR